MKKKKLKKLEIKKETLSLLNIAQAQGGTGPDPYSARCSKAMDCTFTCQPH